MKRFIGFCFIMFSLVSWANNNRGLFQSSNPHSIVGLWNLSLIDDGLEFNCDLGFNSSQNVKIKFWAKGFDPNLGSFKVIIDEGGKYNIHIVRVTIFKAILL